MPHNSLPRPVSASPNRRDLLKTAGFSLAGLAMSPWLSSLARGADTGARKKILFFTKSSGFQHSVITRSAKDPEKLAFAEQILTDVGAKNGFDVTCSKDGTIFTPERIKDFDAYVFYTTGDLTKDSDKYGTKTGPDGKKSSDKELLWKEPGMGEAGKQLLLDSIKDGKGFLALHCGSDTFHSHSKVSGELIRNVDENGKDDFDPYIQMLGGEFIIHGKQQKSVLRCVDPKFPGAEALNGADYVEEWYALKNFAPDLHVILVQDTQGMEGPMYQRKSYPETWARMHGKGRVFYSSLGHRDGVWEKPQFQGLLVGALKWATREVDVDVAPNIKEVTPEADPKNAK